jgi:hypothetical protein
MEALLFGTRQEIFDRSIFGRSKGAILPQGQRARKPAIFGSSVDPIAVVVARGRSIRSEALR